MSTDSLELNTYNSYLSARARFEGRGFTPIDDLVNLAESERLHLGELLKFFKTHSHVNVDLYMYAPFSVFTKHEMVDLHFMTKPISMKIYFLYLKKLNDCSPDTEDNLLHIKNSLKFIKDFCVEKNIPLTQYLSYRESATYEWCLHLLNNDISIYNIIGFSYFKINIYMMINQLPPDEKELFLRDYSNKIKDYMDKLNETEKAKILIIKGYNLIKKIIRKELKR